MRSWHAIAERIREGFIALVLHDESNILPDVSRVLACLYEKNIRFRTIKIKNYTPVFSLKEWPHPRSRVVSFLDGPTFLEDSREICRHIAEKLTVHSSLGRMASRGLQLSNGSTTRSTLSTLRARLCSTIWPSPWTMTMTLTCKEGS
ncbi:hypothetical protein SEVIR_3G402066v4 [Setaria viridis]